MISFTISYCIRNPFARPTLEVHCSAGTYIRRLVDDLGLALDSAAHVTRLVRTQQGQFKLAHALVISRWTAEDILTATRPIPGVGTRVPRLTVPDPLGMSIR